ncbi:PDGLE domain-containing protein [Oryzobacter sp. R7]|uniref:PDGLE domain-containing protein n=1 Tax=Oryzobacter faecalis TaxID=3388656 RepID=UPI00398D0B26
MTGVRPGRTRAGTRAVVTAGMAVSLLLAAVVSSYASGHPDGLEFVSAQLGFLDTARDSVTSGSPLADYAVSGIDGSRLSGGLAGVVGVVTTAAVMLGLVAVLRRLGRRRQTERD